MIKSVLLAMIILISVSGVLGAPLNASEATAHGGDRDISIGYEDDTWIDFVKRIFSSPFSTVGGQTNIWVADNFVIGDFGSVRIDISGEKYTYNQGDNLKILSFFNYPNGQNIRVKIFKENKLTNIQTQVHDTGNFNTGNWVWAYWVIERNNVQAGTYIVKSYYGDNIIRTKEYIVKPLPPSLIFNVNEVYQTDSDLNLNLLISKGSVNIHKYEVDFGDGDTIDNIRNIRSLNVPVNHKYTNSGDYTIKVTITDTELNEYETTYPVKIVDGGIYSDTILEYEEYQNLNDNGIVNLRVVLNPNLDRQYRILVDGEIVYDSVSIINTSIGVGKQVELFMGRHDITTESTYDGMSYVEVYNGVLYVRYIPTIAYNTNYVNSISGTLEHNGALIDTEILLYKNGEYLNKANTVNGYYSFSGLEDGIYNVVFMGNDEFVDVKSPEINLGDVSGIDVKTIDLNKPTLSGYIESIIYWFRGLL